MRGKQGHILRRCAAVRKARRGFDILRSAPADNPAHADFFFFCQKTGLNDDLQQLTLARLLNGTDFLLYRFVLTGLQPSDIDHHIDFIGAGGHGIRRLEALSLCCAVAVREADYRTDRNLSLDILGRRTDVTGRNADRGAAVPNALVANFPNVLPGRRLLQQSVIDLRQNFFQLHYRSTPLFCSLIFFFQQL